MAPHLASYPYLPLEVLFPGIGIPLLRQTTNETHSLPKLLTEAILPSETDRTSPTLPKPKTQKKIKKWLQQIQKEKTISFPELAKMAHVCTKTFINVLQNKTRLHQSTADRIETALRPFIPQKKSLKRKLNN